MKIIYIDTETTGLNPVKNGVIQFAYIVEIDKEVKEKGNLFIAPFENDEISVEALEVHGYTEQQIKEFEPAGAQYEKIVNMLSKYIDRYDKTDKFTAAGHNVRFDIDFMRQFFIKNNDRYFGSFFDYHTIDTMSIAGTIEYIKNKKHSNLKLETLCNDYDIEIKAHDAFSDIEATRELFLNFTKYFNI